MNQDSVQYKKGKWSEGLQRFDFLGHDVRMTFERKGNFTNNIGAIVSLLCGSLLMVIYVVKTAKLFGGIDATVSMLPMPRDINQDIDLWELHYMFAI